MTKYSVRQNGDWVRSLEIEFAGLDAGSAITGKYEGSPINGKVLECQKPSPTLQSLGMTDAVSFIFEWPAGQQIFMGWRDFKGDTLAGYFVGTVASGQFNYRYPWLATKAAAVADPGRSVTFGSDANAFTVNFVTVGNPGNGGDAGAGDGRYRSPVGAGAVPYPYRISVTAVPQEWIEKAKAMGYGKLPEFGDSNQIYQEYPLQGKQPAIWVSWIGAALFVNWLNTSQGFKPAYKFSYNTQYKAAIPELWDVAESWQLGGVNRFRNKDAKYFLPSENEWYKAAYHKNDGVTANYWDYATGSNNPPSPVAGGTAVGSAVYASSNKTPADVDNAGGLSPYGTMGQGGNTYEWVETSADRANTNGGARRMTLGGQWQAQEPELRSDVVNVEDFGMRRPYTGFRIAALAS
jgi:formylglycine-generating enzyme required for sulfatase activity